MTLFITIGVCIYVQYVIMIVLEHIDSIQSNEDHMHLQLNAEPKSAELMAMHRINMKILKIRYKQLQFS